MTPHIARLPARPLSGSVLLVTGLLGALFPLGADTIAQHFLPVALPLVLPLRALGPTPETIVLSPESSPHERQYAEEARLVS